MKTYKKIIFSILVFSSGYFIIGCSQNQLTMLPVTAISSLSFWQTETQIQEATNNAYADLDGIEAINWDGLTENVFCKVDYILEATSGGLGAGATIVNNLWTNSYARIRNANYFFDNIGKSGLSDTILAKYKGQWRFIRAWAYYKLLYSFSDVPLVTVTLAINQGVIPQTARKDVLSFVLSELNLAFAELSSPDYNPGPGRITKWAVLALESRIQLYEGTLATDQNLLQQCVTSSKQIIDQGGFQLYPVYTMLFRPEGENNDETILSRVYPNVPGQTNWLTAWLAPISFLASWDQVTPTQALRDMYLDVQGNPINQSAIYDPASPFKNRDGRMYQTIFEYNKSVTYGPGIFINDGTTYNFRKYIDPNVTDQSKTHTNWILFRLGEIYLNYAEAKNEINGPSQDIVDLINALRIRGGKNAAPDNSDIVMTPLVLTGLTKESLRSMIHRERIVELVGEGNLYYDYHRWKMLGTTMNNPAVGITVLGSRSFQDPRDYLWPIPSFELINNKLLKQNSGWN